MNTNKFMYVLIDEHVSTCSPAVQSFTKVV